MLFSLWKTLRLLRLAVAKLTLLMANLIEYKKEKHAEEMFHTSLVSHKKGLMRTMRIKSKTHKSHKKTCPSQQEK